VSNKINCKGPIEYAKSAEQVMVKLLKE